MRTAATGMLTQQLNVDAIANNIANVNTTGFKKDRMNIRALFYSTLREPGSPTAGSQMLPTGLQVGSGSEVSSSVKLFQQGDLEPTGAPLDVAISGEGFFKISMGTGEFRYTRDGSFRQDGNGDIVTVDGYKLEPAVNIPPDATEVIVGQDGKVLVTKPGNATPQQIGQIRISRFANSSGLKAQGDNLFSPTASSGAPTDLTPTQAGAGLLKQKFRERSNVLVVDELIELIQAQRNYEVNSRTIKVADEMLQQISNLIR